MCLPRTHGIDVDVDQLVAAPFLSLFRLPAYLSVRHDDNRVVRRFTRADILSSDYISYRLCLHFFLST